MRLVLALALALLLPGCLEQGPAPGGESPATTTAPMGPTATPPVTSPEPSPTPSTPTLTPTPEPAPPPEGEPLSVRSLESGQHLEDAQEPAREVFRDRDAWHAFYQAHAQRVYEGDSYEPRVPPTPEADFGNETVVAVHMGQRSSGCYHIRVSNATYESGETVIEVTSYLPTPEMACTGVVTYPYDYVAIPTRAGDVRFEEREAAGAPP